MRHSKQRNAAVPLEMLSARCNQLYNLWLFLVLYSDIIYSIERQIARLEFIL